MVKKTQELPYEGQVYINANINILRDKFHEFVSKHTDPKTPRAIIHFNKKAYRSNVIEVRSVFKNKVKLP